LRGCTRIRQSGDRKSKKYGRAEPGRMTKEEVVTLQNR
jgi:hypothetical protein